MILIHRSQMDNLQKEIQENQDALNQLLKRLMQKYNLVEQDLKHKEQELCDVRNELVTANKSLEEADRKIALLETERHELRRYLKIQDLQAPEAIWSDMAPMKTAKADLDKLNKTVESLQKKLKEEAVELSAIAEKIQIRAETHGLAAANAMFDTVCLLLDDVPGWKKNKKTLETFFRDYKKRANVENNFNAPVGMVIEKAK